MEAEDSTIKHVFDNLRNNMSSATMVFIGYAIIAYKTELPLGSEFNCAIGRLIIGIATFLTAWNMNHGARKLLLPVLGTRKAWLRMPVVILYILTYTYVFWFIPLIKSQNIV